MTFKLPFYFVRHCDTFFIALLLWDVFVHRSYVFLVTLELHAERNYVVIWAFFRYVNLSVSYVISSLHYQYFLNLVLRKFNDSFDETNTRFYNELLYFFSHYSFCHNNMFLFKLALSFLW